MRNKILTFLFLYITFFSSAQFIQDNYSFTIEQGTSSFIVSAIFIHPTNPPPITGDEISDIVFAIKLPLAYTNSNISFGVISTDYNIIKNGTLKSRPTFKYQDFSTNAPLTVTSNWIRNVPVLLATIPYTLFSPMSGDQAFLASFGEVSNNLPNINIEFDDFTPEVSGFVALPIKLSLFDVVKYDATSAKIDWKSAKEVNSDFFDLERSEDGVSWTQVTTIKAAGNTSNTQEYSYIDSNLPGTRTSNKIFYYRLRMVDLDGSFAYSDVRGVNFTRSKAEEYLTVYPSPTANRLNIDMSSFTLDNGDISLEIYDQLGKRVMTKDIIGTGIELIDVSDLPASVYVLKVTQDIKIHTKQFVKID